MKVLLRFNEAYDKYLFEGIIDHKDLFRREAVRIFQGPGGSKDLFKEGQSPWKRSSLGPGNPLFTGVVSPPSMNDELTNYEVETSRVNIYVLNTLDSLEGLCPSWNLQSKESSFKFFDSIKGPEEGQSLFEEHYILLLAPQNPEIFNKIVEIFYNKVSGSSIPSNASGSVIVYNTSFLAWKNLSKNSHIFPGPELKHFQIDMSLALSAIELFNRKNLNLEVVEKDNYLQGYWNQYPQTYDLQIPTPKPLEHLKGLKIFKPGIRNIGDIGNLFLSRKDHKSEGFNRLYKFFTSDHHEDYKKRLIPLIPFVNYRILDSLETFHLKLVPFLYKKGTDSSSLSKIEESKSKICLVIKLENLKLNFLVSEIEKFIKLNNSLLISNLFSIPWTHIYLNNEDSKSSVLETPLEFLYNFISEIYAQKKYKTFIKNLKRNPDYSLLWEDDDVDFSESYKQKTIKNIEENPPALILSEFRPKDFSESFLENFYVL